MLVALNPITETEAFTDLAAILLPCGSSSLYRPPTLWTILGSRGRWVTRRALIRRCFGAGPRETLEMCDHPLQPSALPKLVSSFGAQAGQEARARSACRVRHLAAPFSPPSARTKDNDMFSDEEEEEEEEEG